MSEIAKTLVIITRPKDRAETLQTLCAEANLDHLVLPAISIEPLSVNHSNQLQEDSTLIFTSIYAVQHGQAILDQYQGQDCYAIGQATQQALQAKGITAKVAQPANSEGLIAKIKTSHLLPKHIVLLQGKDSRGLMQQAFTKSGIAFDEINVYQRVAISPIEVQDLAKIKAHKHCILTASSADILTACIKAMPKDCLTKLQQQPLVVVSERIAQYAKQNAFQYCTIAQSASNTDIFAAIQQVITH